MMKQTQTKRTVWCDRIRNATVSAWLLSGTCMGIVMTPALFGCTPAAVNGDGKNPAAVAEGLAAGEQLKSPKQ